MNMTCPGCRKQVEADEQGRCPACAQPLVSSPPAPSVIGSEDAELLQRDGVKPPSRLGAMARVGKFEIVRPLGQGGMAKVYLATEPVTGTAVALKMLRPELAEDPRMVAAFLAEARHMYELSHPNILKVLEVSPPAEGAYFVMQLARGDSLDQRIGPHGMAPAEILDVCTQVATGLAYAHSKGLLHRDLKPANVLLDGEGGAMICDFGLVRPFFDDAFVTGEKPRPVGTPAYMSPRVAAGYPEDTRGDIYAFGAMLYEMLAGRPPYRGRDSEAVLQAVVDGPPEPISDVNPEASVELSAVSEWCMGRELRNRYATMNDVLADLERIAADGTPIGPHGSDAAPPAEPLDLSRRMSRPAVIAAAVLVVGLVAGLLIAGILHARSGGSVPSLLQAAERHVSAGDLDAAATQYRAVLATDAANVTALCGLGAIALKRNRPAEGTDFLRRAHEQDPANAEVNSQLAGHLIRVGHYHPAREVVNRWLVADPDSAAARAMQERLTEAEASGGGAAEPWRGPPGGSARRPAGRPGPPPGVRRTD